MSTENRNPTAEDWAREARRRGISPPTASDEFIHGFRVGSMLIDDVRASVAWMHYSREMADADRLHVEAGGMASGTAQGEEWHNRAMEITGAAR